ncbi:winged helix-turn-helix domain-containing protein [Rhizobium mesoamericanum]|uniref:Phosphate regulon transcriptional regulatory protein PhoB n=1 Tax=Rhizobium mesoamericanum STM3625 TaxID=1211777 RepID=K0Q5T5_9HYPH|nr:winged helix-turn-helix domain-containing protein [Rhizobium mesoamericanum]CCM80287.1 Phosphate regulon transcriptional regulatory protein PhoB [Rhizobium mesoamericanum STM3625]
MSNDAASPSCIPPPLVLIAAADDSFRAFLEYIVKSRGLIVTGVRDGEALANRLQTIAPDLLLLESRIPGVETQALCKQLRLDHRTRSMLIIALAAEGDEASRQRLLESGADQYLSRPFSPETVMTSIGAIWQNTNSDPAPGDQELFAFRDLELDISTYRVRRNGRMIHLAPTEFRLLHHLIKSPRRVYSRDELRKAAWLPAVHVGPRTIDVHIGRLRAALNSGDDQNLIRTVRSVGYALSE